MADETCETSMLDSPCFEQNQLLFSCPGTNDNPNNFQELISGHYGVKCWICSFDNFAYVDGILPDADTRTGHILVDLKFGPNMLGNKMDESPISGYAVFLDDMDGNRYSETPVITVQKREMAPSAASASCCEEAAYTARITLKLPDGVDKARFEVTPVLNGLGPLGAGRISEPVVDVAPFDQVTQHSSKAMSRSALSLAATMITVCMACWRTFTSPPD